MNSDDRIAKLEEFRALLREWNKSQSYPPRRNPETVRSKINQGKSAVRQIVIECGCLKTFTIGPPPAIGGLVMHNVDAFNVIFDPPWGMDMIPPIIDMVDEAIGVLRATAHRSDDPAVDTAPTIDAQIVKGYAFVAMPMDVANPRLGDVLDAIKEAAARCGVQAERVDDVVTNDRITDRILESIRRAEFVVADLTDSRPNVYFEAGYAHALGKTPIYIAAHGTTLAFDLKDYPVIFFSALRDLKTELERRLRTLGSRRKAG
jgi:hypothetical protein